MRASLAGAILTFTACGNSFSSSPGTDAGSDVSTADVGTPDAAGDAGPTDAPSGADVLGDGPVGPSEGGPVGSYCATHVGTYDFCEDFDSFMGVTAFLSSWTTFSQNGATFTFDTMNVPSPPNALKITTTSTSKVSALAIKAMPPATAPIAKQRIEFDFLVDQASAVQPLSVAAVAGILFGNDVSGGVVALAFGNGSGSSSTLQAIYEGPTPADGGLPSFGSSNVPSPTLMQWDGRYAIEIDYPGPDAGATTGATACVQLIVGGIAQLNPCLALPSELSHPPTATSIALGVYSGGLEYTGEIGVGFDNVTFVGQ